MRRPLVSLLVAAAALAGVQFRTHAQAPVGLDATLFREMKWRNIGPFVGGRTSAVAGVPSQPNTFYIGVDNGGGAARRPDRSGQDDDKQHERTGRKRDRIVQASRAES